MQLTKYINTLGSDLKKRYGEKVHKLTLHGNFTCPNRDGTLGKGGCTFCNVSAFSDERQAEQSIEIQLASRALEVKHKAKKYLAYFQAYTSTYAEIAKKYLAYFQAYTSTYAEIKQLASLYEQATVNQDIVGLCVGTRPDCVSDEVLNLLSSYLFRGYEVWLELGLQSANDKTLKRINRGHGFAQYQLICQKARARGLKVCTHLILGLPGESDPDYRQTLQQVVDIGVDGLKFHPLHVVRGAIMEKSWRAGRLKTLSLEQYSQSVVSLIRHTPPEVVFHRISATAKIEQLVSPLWCEKRWPVQNRIGKLLQELGSQGSAL